MTEFRSYAVLLNFDGSKQEVGVDECWNVVVDGDIYRDGIYGKVAEGIGVVVNSLLSNPDRVVTTKELAAHVRKQEELPKKLTRLTAYTLTQFVSNGISKIVDKREEHLTTLPQHLHLMGRGESSRNLFVIDERDPNRRVALFEKYMQEYGTTPTLEISLMDLRDLPGGQGIRRSAKRIPGSPLTPVADSQPCVAESPNLPSQPAVQETMKLPPLTQLLFNESSEKTKDLEIFTGNTPYYVIVLSMVRQAGRPITDSEIIDAVKSRLGGEFNDDALDRAITTLSLNGYSSQLSRVVVQSARQGHDYVTFFRWTRSKPIYSGSVMDER